MKLLLRPGVTRAIIHPAASRAFSTTPFLPRAKGQSKSQSRKERARVSSVKEGAYPWSRLRLDSKYTGRHAVFRSTVLARFQTVLKRFNDSYAAVSGVDEDEINLQATQFMDVLEQAFLMAEQNITSREKNPLFWNLRDALILKDVKGLTNELQFSFQSYLLRQRFAKGLEESHKRLLDFRFPDEWFPATRAMQRTIHVHVGPTNSGKTYRALKALENSRRGVYAGPLRLLATEVYQRLTAKGLNCALVTGEELRIPETSDRYFKSCTVEMTPLNEEFDVAVIDEIQMLGDPDRGNAWTSALLGVQAKEVHLCGEERTVKLIESICATIGDKCIVHRYDRLSPLETMPESLKNDFSRLQKGDAVVAFSRLNLHSLKRTIEKATGRRCAIIYGNLPPEVRVQQAALFNDPDNDYDFIAASDAIGMGLNLEIRRVILESVNKFDGFQNRDLTHPEIKQIGGRAGRYRSARNATASSPVPGAEENKVGYVTTLDQADLRLVRRAFTTPAKDIESAYIQPPAAAIERFASYFPPGTPLSFILMRIRDLATVGTKYHLSIPDETLQLADIIQDIPLTIYDRLTLSHLPISLRAEGSIDAIRALARVIANNENGDLLNIEEIPLEFLDIDPRTTDLKPHEYLYKLESLHSAINMYLWLSYRYQGMFRSQALAFHVRSLVEESLVNSLERLDFTEMDLETRRSSKRREVNLRKKTHGVVREEELNVFVGDRPLDDTPPAGSEDEYTPIGDEDKRDWRINDEGSQQKVTTNDSVQKDSNEPIR